MKRSRYPGDPRGGPPKTAPPKKPDKLEVHTVFWKDTEDRQKGTIWFFHSWKLMGAGGFRGDQDIPWRQQAGHQTSLLIARGKKWYAIYSDEEQYLFLASPITTKRLMADIVSRWPTPPLKLRLGSGPAFTVKDLKDETHSHVYLVQLLTFHQTAAGQHYYKIGKAKSIPRRIKQFGPCNLVASIKLPTEQDSLKVEAELHSKFSCFRRPGTEIFCMDQAQLKSVLDVYLLYENRLSD